MNKKIKGLLIVLTIIFLIIITYLIFNKLIMDRIKIEDNEQYIANMYYSYMLGMDAGTDYNILIYNNNDNSYKYEITKSDITITGSTNKKKYKKGIIKSKKDLIKLNNEFINKKVNKVEIYHSYYRLQNKPSYDLEFEELVSELFK